MRSKAGNLLYILPNLFTAASIFVAMLSIVNAIEHKFDISAWFIFLSLIFDGLDGRVARLTKTCSRFGIEFDSLADIVAFGVAPAILIYLFVGIEFGRFGISVSALFVIFGAIRLARFNVMTSLNEPSVFIGVPIPTAAVFLSLLVLIFNKYNISGNYGVIILIISIFVSILMVSNIRYPSFKKVDLTPKHMMKLFALILGIGLGLFMFPIEGLSVLFSIYIFYGPIRALILLKKHLLKK